MIFNWKGHLVTNPEERERSCWISPNGEWFNVEFGVHEYFAMKVMEELYPEEVKNLKFLEEYCAQKLSQKHGWISVYHDPFTGTVLQGHSRMNEKQFRVLHSYFGEERLFRGWTIKQLYAEAIDKRGD